MEIEEIMDVDDIIWRNEKKRIIWEFINRLQENYRVTLILWMELDGSERAIAKELGVPVTRARNWIRRGKQALKRLIESECPELKEDL